MVPPRTGVSRGPRPRDPRSSDRPVPLRAVPAPLRPVVPPSRRPPAEVVRRVPPLVALRPPSPVLRAPVPLLRAPAVPDRSVRSEALRVALRRAPPAPPRVPDAPPLRAPRPGRSAPPRLRAPPGPSVDRPVPLPLLARAFDGVPRPVPLPAGFGADRPPPRDPEPPAVDRPDPEAFAPPVPRRPSGRLGLRRDPSPERLFITPPRQSWRYPDMRKAGRRTIRLPASRKNPAATYSPRGLPPKYHRRGRSSLPCSEWERVFPRRNCHRKPHEIVVSLKDSIASTNNKDPKPSAD